MGKPRKVERVINMRGTGVLPVRDRVKVHNIQVRKGVPLPDLGQRVVAMDEHRIIKFAGEVVDVDFENHTYDVELRPSMETDAPTLYQADPIEYQYGGRRVA